MAKNNTLTPEARKLRDAGAKRRARMLKAGAKNYAELRSLTKGPVEYRSTDKLDLSWLPEHELTWEEFKKLVCRHHRLELNGPNTKVAVEGFLTGLRANGLATATGYGDQKVIRKLADRLPERREEPKTYVRFTPDVEDPTLARLAALDRRIAALETAHA